MNKLIIDKVVTVLDNISANEFVVEEIFNSDDTTESNHESMFKIRIKKFLSFLFNYLKSIIKK
jgi:hypothetical protein